MQTKTTHLYYFQNVSLQLFKIDPFQKLRPPLRCQNDTQSIFGDCARRRSGSRTTSKEFQQHRHGLVVDGVVIKGTSKDAMLPFGLDDGTSRVRRIDFARKRRRHKSDSSKFI
jgi:hypothetical protein